jgi:hypothetical protein
MAKIKVKDNKTLIKVMRRVRDDKEETKAVKKLLKMILE